MYIYDHRVCKIFKDQSIANFQNLVAEMEAFGSTKNIEVTPTFYLGNVNQSLLKMDIVKRNLMGITNGFVGCLKDLYLNRYKLVVLIYKNQIGQVTTLFTRPLYKNKRNVPAPFSNVAANVVLYF